MADETKVEGTTPSPTTEPAPDLEVLRDTRVVPIAREVIGFMAKDDTPSDLDAKSDFTAVLISTLRLALDADLNLLTENPEIFKHVIGAYGALGTVLQGCKVKEEDNQRYSRISKQFLLILAKANVPMGTKVTPKEQSDVLEAHKSELEEIISRENLTWNEVKYIMEGALRSLKAVQEFYSYNVERSVKRMEAKILHLEDMSDLSMKKLDEVLQQDIKESEEAKK